MRTFNGSNCHIHYNSDLSGEVIIISENEDTVAIHGEDMLDFIAEFIRQKKLSKIEEMSNDELLSL